MFVYISFCLLCFVLLLVFLIPVGRCLFSTVFLKHRPPGIRKTSKKIKLKKNIDFGAQVLSRTFVHSPGPRELARKEMDKVPCNGQDPLMDRIEAFQTCLINPSNGPIMGTLHFSPIVCSIQAYRKEKQGGEGRQHFLAY